MPPSRRTVLQLSASGILMGVLPKRAAAERDTVNDATFKLSDAQWRERLSSAQFHVLREHDTERPFSSPLNKEGRKGRFVCAGCQQALFDSKTKFDSRTGWPSFWRPAGAGVGESVDRAYGMTRTEVHCQRCGGHLGHVFPDGPAPTGLRYCINGAALQFVPATD